MQLFTIVLEQPIPFGISLLARVGTIVLIVLKSAMSTEERRPRWVRFSPARTCGS